MAMLTKDLQGENIDRRVATRKRRLERVVKICGDLCKSVSQYSLRARRLCEIF